MNYLYSKLDDATFAKDTPERQAFARHLKLVIDALHDIEWVDSGDYGPGRENEAIRACLNKTDVLEGTIETAKVVINVLIAELERAQKCK